MVLFPYGDHIMFPDGNHAKIPHPGDVMSDQNPYPGDIRDSQIPLVCPTPPLGLDSDRCIMVRYQDNSQKAIQISLRKWYMTKYLLLYNPATFHK